MTPSFGPEDVQVIDISTVYDGFFTITAERLRYRCFGGGWSQEVTREVFHRGHAVAVLPYDPARDRVVLIEQFRAPARNAPGGPWIIEAVAGMIEDDEAAEEVARREAEEEIDCRLHRLHRLFAVMPSPGGCSERVHLFCGQVDSASAGGIHGLDEEHEDIRTLVLDAGEAIAAIGSRIRSGPAVMLLQWLALNRETLREAWQS